MQSAYSAGIHANIQNIGIAVLVLLASPLDLLAHSTRTLPCTRKRITNEWSTQSKLGYRNILNCTVGKYDVFFI